MIEYLGREFLLRFSIISLGLYFLRSLRKGFCMALTSSSASSSSSSPLTSPPPTWIASLFLEKAGASTSFKPFGGNNIISSSKRQKMICSFKNQDHHHQHHQEEKILVVVEEKAPEGSGGSGGPVVVESSSSVTSYQINPPRGEMIIKQSMLRKRPAQLVVPAFCPAMDFGEVEKKLERKEFEVEGKGFALASKKGKREVMEDRHGVMLDISGNPKQAFFVVIDGHGGRAAADFVAENLGRNIINEIQVGNHQIEAAVRRGYSVTDDQFLNQKVHGGACAASVLVKDGELHVANVGDCKVILSRGGVANALTNDHRLTREDERARIENSGGFLDCRNGVWRVNGTLAVSRAFGDFYLKDHVISEPDTLQLPLTSDCQFLIVASDGLWDKVGEQEAVDVVNVSRKKDSLESCKELVAMSSSRGCVDDITVMVINLQNFVNYCT